jgi:hypothetical protein
MSHKLWNVVLFSWKIIRFLVPKNEKSFMPLKIVTMLCTIEVVFCKKCGSLPSKVFWKVSCNGLSFRILICDTLCTILKQFTDKMVQKWKGLRRKRVLFVRSTYTKQTTQKKNT